MKVTRRGSSPRCLRGEQASDGNVSYRTCDAERGWGGMIFETPIGVAGAGVSCRRCVLPRPHAIGLEMATIKSKLVAVMWSSCSRRLFGRAGKGGATDRHAVAGI